MKIIVIVLMKIKKLNKYGKMKQETLEWWCNLKQIKRDKIIENAHDGYIKKQRAKERRKEIPKLSKHTHKVMNELAGGTQ